MKFQYNLDLIVSALSYNDLKGLLILVGYPIKPTDTLAISDMEQVFKELFYQKKELDKEKFKEIEKLMLSCARVNSIGY